MKSRHQRLLSVPSFSSLVPLPLVSFPIQLLHLITTVYDFLVMAESQKHWGVTGSISFARPTEEEVSANAALIEELKSQGSFESAEESQRR